jgi:hypothetical protein
MLVRRAALHALRAEQGVTVAGRDRGAVAPELGGWQCGAGFTAAVLEGLHVG